MSRRMRPLVWAISVLMSLGIMFGIHTMPAQAAPNCWLITNTTNGQFAQVRCDTSRQYRVVAYCKPVPSMEWYYGTLIRTHYGPWKSNNEWSVKRCPTDFYLRGWNQQFAA